jgi:hypothetical protein
MPALSFALLPSCYCVPSRPPAIRAAADYSCDNSYPKPFKIRLVPRSDMKTVQVRERAAQSTV